MFGWPHADVEAECEALGKMGWMGVKVFPAMESVTSYEWPQSGELNPCTGTTSPFLTTCTVAAVPVTSFAT